MLCRYGKREWLTIIAVAAMVIATALWLNIWWLAAAAFVLAFVMLLFFRDPYRVIPTDRGVVVSPADGMITSIHRLNSFEPFGEGAVCVRIFLSVLDVHVNRSPCHGVVTSVHYQPGKHANAMNPKSALMNESNLIVLTHPTRKRPVAAIKQIAGLIARTIACGIAEGQVVQRGQRIGMIKFGSTTELYLPESLRPQVVVEYGQMVHGGSTIMANITPYSDTSPGASQAQAAAGDANAPTPTGDANTPAPTDQVSMPNPQ